jgi:predicted GNAT family acetyltransferase
MCGLLEAAIEGRSTKQPTLLECLDNGKTVAVAIQSGLHLIVTEGAGRFSEILARYLFEQKISLPGVIGPDADAEHFAKSWCALQNCQMKLAMNQRIYQLRKIDWPKGINGSARLVTMSDAKLMAHWLEGFYLEAIPWELPSKEKILSSAEARIPQSMTYFWEVDGKPVCMAALSRPSKRGISIGAVYTPPEHRQKGYATGLVAAVSSEGLKLGKDFCVLYTDLSNPTSNSIYQKIGYRPVGDSKNFIFVD